MSSGPGDGPSRIRRTTNSGTPPEFRPPPSEFGPPTPPEFGQHPRIRRHPQIRGGASRIQKVLNSGALPEFRPPPNSEGASRIRAIPRFQMHCLQIHIICTCRGGPEACPNLRAPVCEPGATWHGMPPEEELNRFPMVLICPPRGIPSIHPGIDTAVESARAALKAQQDGQ